MPKIIIQASQAAGESCITLSERVIAANLDSPHYTAQLIQRIAWATGDAEAIESGSSAGEPERHHLAPPRRSTAPQRRAPQRGGSQRHVAQTRVSAVRA